jgi:fructose-bisphosphate aldolase class II
VQIALHTDHCRASQLDSFLIPVLEESVRHRASSGRPLFNSQMFDGSDLAIDENLDISARLLERTSAADVILEIEIGVVGATGPDGVHSGGTLTRPDEFVEVAQRLGVGERGRYILAPAFGNVHGIARAAGQGIDTAVLQRGQEALRRAVGLQSPLFLAFHGGSGSSTEVIRESIRHGVVKFNVDTDTQYAFSGAIADYVQEHHPQMVGVGDVAASKAAFDTRAYLRNAEIRMATQVQTVCENVLSAGRSLGR